MADLASVLRDAGWLLAGRLAGQGLAVLVTVVLAARLGLVGFGGYALLVAVVTVAGVVTTFGTDMALIRDIAAHDRADRWPAALAVQLGLSAVAMVLIWAGAAALARLGPGLGPDLAGALRLYSVSLIPAAAFSVATAGLRGAGRMRAYAAVGATGAALTLVAVWMFIPAGAGLGRVAMVLVAIQAALAGVAWSACAAGQADFRRLRRPTREDLSAMTRASGRIGILGILGVLYQRSAVVALALVAGPAATAWFVAASRVVETSKAGHVAWFGALFPSLAAARQARAVDTPNRLGRAWWLTIGAGASIAAVLIAIGPSVVELLFGPAFGPSAGLLAILALSIVPSTASTHRSLELVAAGRETEMARALALSLGLLIALLVGLLPVFGRAGAALAVLGAETGQAAILFAPLAARRWSSHAWEGGRELPQPG